MAETGKDIQKAMALLRDGKLVAIPTETVYGLAANALDEKAVLAIFEAKQRPFFDPLIIHLPTIDAIKNYAELSDARLRLLAEKFWPGPLTLLLPKHDNIPDLVTSGLPQVAVRIPRHPLTLELLDLVQLPLAAPSANPFGYISPTQALHVEKQLGAKIGYILDGGPSGVGIESTIAGIEGNELCVYRLGGITVEEIEAVAGSVRLRVNHSSDPKAPGQLKNHYAPLKPLYIGDLSDLAHKFADKKKAVLSFGPFTPDSSMVVYELSRKKDLREAALNLFKLLREADEGPAEVILCAELPETGLGRAINDRLLRASVQ